MGAPSTPPGGPPAPTGEQSTAEGHRHHIEVDPELDEDDGYSSAGISSASTSIASSIFDFTWENNRRYQSREGYHFPNDEPEQERENVKHIVVVELLGDKLYLAPIDLEGKQVLDVGTGTGAWAIDAGDEFTTANILGIDLSPIQPSWVPPNVRFRVDSVEDEWVDNESFDYIHARHMNATLKDWPKFFDQSFRHTNPGGWIELQEYEFTLKSDNNTLTEDWPFAKTSKLIHQGLNNLGIMPNAVRNNAQYLRDAGYINVEEKVYKIPIGPWARDPRLKRIGLYNRHMIMEGLQAITMAPLTRGLNWKAEEVELLLVDVRRTLLESSVHSYFPYHVVYGQKPETS